MEVQDNPNPVEVAPETPSSTLPLVAVAGVKYPIRLLHLMNGMLIIGYVIAVYPETTMVLRPYLVEPIFDETRTNITEYEFEPYLDQMSFFDAHDLVPTPFLNSACVSISRPAHHLVFNYTSIIKLREIIKSTADAESVVLYKRDYVDTRTRH